MASPLSSIDWGSKQASSNIDVWLVQDDQTPAYVVDGVTYTRSSEGWSPYEAQQVDLALTQISNVADVQFNYVPTQDGADMALTTFAGSDSDLLGNTYPPGEVLAGYAAFNTNGYGWDENSPGFGGLEQGGDGFYTLIHEFGHGMGLAHPHDEGGSSTKLKGVSSQWGDYGKNGLNQGVFTVMSFNSTWYNSPDGWQPPVGATYGLAGTMMALDIAVLQNKYGPNISFATGNDIYELPSANGSGTFYSSIWDAGGTDEIRADPFAAAVIDLRAATLKYEPGGGGFISYSRGIHGGFTIANDVMIENATGSQFGDEIGGNEADNILTGLGGNDTINGLGGADTIFGGGGDDYLNGGSGEDMIYFGDGTDTTKGGKGDDHIFAGLLDFSDKVDGGKGTDTLHFSVDGTSHSVKIKKSKIIVDGQKFGKNLESIDVQSGNGDDELKGGKKSDVLDGGGGNDVLIGKNGDDLLIGGAGDDTLFGNKGADVFDFVSLSGTDTVADFATDDMALFSLSELADFSDFLANAAEVNDDTVLTLNSGNVVFKDVLLADFSSDQFNFV